MYLTTGGAKKNFHYLAIGYVILIAYYLINLGYLCKIILWDLFFKLGETSRQDYAEFQDILRFYVRIAELYMKMFPINRRTVFIHYWNYYYSVFCWNVKIHVSDSAWPSYIYSIVLNMYHFDSLSA